MKRRAWGLEMELLRLELLPPVKVKRKPWDLEMELKALELLSGPL